MRDYGEELLSGKAASPPPEKAAKPKRDWGEELLSAKTNPVSINPTSPRRQEFVSQRPFTDDPAGAGTAMLSGTVEDVDSKIALFAKNRFPDIPLNEAVKRYGVHKGDIVFVDDNGNLQQEVAGAAATTGEFVTESGPAIVGGVIGTMLGGPYGAALGSAGGLAARKLVGQYVGDKQTAGGNAVDLAAEALLNWGATKGGELFAKHWVNRRVARDAASFNQQLTTQIIDKGRQFGIKVTPAEASGLASLINQQTRLGKGFDDAGDLIGQFYRERAGQEAAAIDDFIGVTPSGAKAGADVKAVAERTIEGAKETRRAAATPLYKQYVDNFVLPDDVVKSFTDDPLLAKYAQKVVDDPVYGFKGSLDDNKSSLSLWDAAKKALDDDAASAAKEGKMFRASRFGSSTKKITEAVDAINPGYKEARAAYAGLSPEVDAFLEGLEGSLAKSRGKGLAQSARSLFNSADVGPMDVARIRNQFVAQGKEAEWDQTLNYWLRHQWETIKKGKGDPDGVNMAGDWRKRVFGSERQQKIMQLAMGPQRYSAFTDLMEVLEATGRVPKGQSMTQPAMEAAKQESFDAAPVASLTKGFGVGGLRDWWIANKTDAWRTSLAKVITNKDAVDTLSQLRQLRSLNPKSEKAIEVVSLALTQAGVMGGGKVLSTPPSRIPQVLDQQPSK